MNAKERGIEHNGINPALIERRPGGSFTAATSSFRPMTEVLARRLGQLDGQARGVYVIFVRPEDTYFPDMQPERLVEYLQSAGSAEAMTIEIRRLEADGELHQYAVGRSDVESDERTVEWASDDPEHPHRLTVAASEVFTAEQARPIYLQWAWDQTIPPGYRLRELDLSVRTDDAS